MPGSNHPYALAHCDDRWSPKLFVQVERATGTACSPRSRDLYSNCLVIIPALNEKACIGRVVSDAREEGFSNVLVINDGSTDATGEVACKAGAQVLALPFNLGIGGAVQTGLKFALEQGYAYVVRLDGDGQHCVEEAAKLLGPVRQGLADITIGSRFFPHQHTYAAPLGRAMGIRWFSMIVTGLTRQPVYDPTSGMLAMNRRAMRTLAVDYPQDYPEVEARVLMHKARLRVSEVPVVMRHRAGGTSSITLLRAVYYVFKVSLAVVIAALRQSPSHDGGSDPDGSGSTVAGYSNKFGNTVWDPRVGA